MDTRNLLTFKTILAEGSFQKAARRLNYSQSTITFQIRQLENELSVQLFERIGRRMVLSQAGQDLLPQMELILSAMTELAEYGKGKKELTGELRIAVAESLLSYKIQPILKKFVEIAPRVRLSLQSLNCYDIRDGILSGNVDMGIYYQVGGHPASLVVHPLCFYSGIVVASPELAQEMRDFDLPDQEKELSFVINEPRSIYREVFERHLKRKNIVLRNTIELWSIEAIKKSVASNLGFTFLPRFAVEKELAEGTLVEIPVSIDANRVQAICVHHGKKAPGPGMACFKNLALSLPALLPGNPCSLDVAC